MAPGPASIPFGERLQALLDQVGQTQSWLCHKSGVSRSVVCRLLSGDRALSIRQAAPIAAALNLTVDTLVVGTDAEARIAASQYVKREDFEASHQRLSDNELRRHALETQLRHAQEDLERERIRARELLDNLSAQLDRARKALADAASERDAAFCHRRDYLDALSSAATDAVVLKAKLQEVNEAVSGPIDQARLAKALAGVSGIGATSATEYIERVRRKGS